MIVLTGDTRSKRLIELLKKLNWGRMFIDHRIHPYENEPWGFDNGAFRDWKNGKEFNKDRYLKSLDRVLKIAEENNYPYLSVIPDKVAKGKESLDFSALWIEKIKKHIGKDWYKFNWYLALQDGMNIKDVKDFLNTYKQIRGLFLGGTDKFKATAQVWSNLAKEYGLKFHYARAGTPKKYAKAKLSGATSIDSAFPLWIKNRFDYFIKNAETYYNLMKRQKNLFNY